MKHTLCGIEMILVWVRFVFCILIGKLHCICMFLTNITQLCKHTIILSCKRVANTATLVVLVRCILSEASTKYKYSLRQQKVLARFD